ncbi:hypothetical protein [Paraburkholderia acidipaludis]|uniref:hypothetical protein n=1 Tax=Paraburkholderia acidipaludis TaxID=660537 RepID=UPI000B000D0E|nr:hypothetical protein [Paraburkholderia acidipaludis]
MSPNLLLDTLLLRRRAAVRSNDRLVQAAALLCGTLLFLPFLIGYFVACNGQ